MYTLSSLDTVCNTELIVSHYCACYINIIMSVEKTCTMIS